MALAQGDVTMMNAANSRMQKSVMTYTSPNPSSRSTPTSINSLDLLASLCDNSFDGENLYETPRNCSISGSTFITPKRKFDYSDDDDADNNDYSANSDCKKESDADIIAPKRVLEDLDFKDLENDYIIKSEAVKQYKISHADFNKLSFITSETRNIATRRFYSRTDICKFIREKEEKSKKKKEAQANAKDPRVLEQKRKIKQARKKLHLLERSTCVQCNIVRKPYEKLPNWIRCPEYKCERWLHVPCGAFDRLPGRVICSFCSTKSVEILFCKPNEEKLDEFEDFEDFEEFEE